MSGPFWMHCHTAPFVDCHGQNSPSWVGGGWIRRPFRRPVRTWTACSSPRLTRCMMVWRDTPWARVASSIASQPLGALSTNRLRMSSVRRIRQAPGGELFAGDEAVAEPAVQGGGRQSEFLCGVGHGERFSFGRVVAVLVAGNVRSGGAGLDPTGGVWQSAGGAAVLAVEDVARSLRRGSGRRGGGCRSMVSSSVRKVLGGLRFTGTDRALSR